MLEPTEGGGLPSDATKEITLRRKAVRYVDFATNPEGSPEGRAKVVAAVGAPPPGITASIFLTVVGREGVPKQSLLESKKHRVKRSVALKEVTPGFPVPYKDTLTSRSVRSSASLSQINCMACCGLGPKGRPTVEVPGKAGEASDPLRTKAVRVDRAARHAAPLSGVDDTKGAAPPGHPTSKSP